MKKIASLFVFLFLLFQFSTAFGQQKRFAAGIEMGPNAVRLYGNQVLEQNSETTINFYSGWSFQYNINRIFSLRTGLASELKGHTAKFMATDQFGVQTGWSTSRMRYSYLTVPIMVRATLGQNVKYFMNLGSYGGFALKQNTTIETPQQSDMEIDESETLKPYDYGFTAGMGVAFPVSTNLELSLELRNNLGLLNISELPVFQDGSIKTNALNLLFGLAYNFGEIAQPAE